MGDYQVKVCLDLHDFSVVNNRLLWLRSLKDHFPGFKVSLFTVPIDKKEDWGPSLIRNEYLEEIKKNLDWIQIIPHGWEHTGREVKKWDYLYTKQVLNWIKSVFSREGLPYVNGFCAPHWSWNEDVVTALDDEGWWGAVYKNESKPYPKKFYHFSHCIDDFPLDAEVLKLHGHIYGTKNDLGLCFDNLLKLPKDTEWHFVTDFLEEK